MDVQDRPSNASYTERPNQKNLPRYGHLRFISIIILTAILSGISGYIIREMQGASSQQTAQSNLHRSPTGGQQVTRPTAPVVASNTAGNYDIVKTHERWNIYRNEGLCFTIHYPDGFRVETEGEKSVIVVRIGVPYGGQEGSVPYGALSLYYRGDNGIENNQEYIVFSKQYTYEDVTLNGYRAKRSTDGIQSKYGEYSYGSYVVDNNNERVIAVGINTDGDAGYEELTYELFLQIASTLEFLPKEQCEPS